MRSALRGLLKVGAYALCLVSMLYMANITAGRVPADMIGLSAAITAIFLIAFGRAARSSQDV